MEKQNFPKIKFKEKDIKEAKQVKKPVEKSKTLLKPIIFLNLHFLLLQLQ